MNFAGEKKRLILKVKVKAGFKTSDKNTLIGQSVK